MSSKREAQFEAFKAKIVKEIEDSIKNKRKDVASGALPIPSVSYAVEQRIDDERTDALNKSRNVLKGKIGEHMAPLLKEFYEKYKPSEARFMGAPVDYIIFKNKDGEKPIEVILLDVKTGKAALNKDQKRIKDAVEHNRVGFEILRINDVEQVEEKNMQNATVRGDGS